MRILIVEDDGAHCRTACKALTDQHYIVDIATDGQAGWKFVKPLSMN